MTDTLAVFPGEQPLPAGWVGRPRIVPPAETRRVHRRITPRATAFLDWAAGVGHGDAGGWHAPPRAPLAALLAAVPPSVERLYLTGPRPHAASLAAFGAWAHGPLPDGWAAGRHYLDRPDTPVLRFDGPGRSVELLRAAPWWGEDAGPVRSWGLHAALAGVLAREWEGGVLLSSPASTGRDLLLRSLPRDTAYPTLPDELAQLVRDTSGQGRIELRPPAAPQLGQLVELDGRTMYGALCRELPRGLVEHGYGDHTYGDYARCRVLVSWRPPDGWPHLGLLPARADDGSWTYPTTGHHKGWVDGVELHLARRWGWRPIVHEHLVWPEGGPGPLDAWSRRLLALMDWSRAELGEYGADVAGALRHLLIDALGALVGRPYRVTRSLPLDQADEVPAGAVRPYLADDRIVWTEEVPPAWPELVHPEWSAAVWARCRVRMLDGPPAAGGHRTGALHVWPDEVVAIRTDALYLASDPGWADDGRHGRLRVKRCIPGPLAWPRTVGELLALRGTDGPS